MVSFIGLLGSRCPSESTSIICILRRVAGTTIFRWQKTPQPVTLPPSLQVQSAALESWGSHTSKYKNLPSRKLEIYFRDCCLALPSFPHLFPSVSLYFVVMVGEGWGFFFFPTFLKSFLFPSQGIGLGLSNSLLRNFCVKVQPRLGCPHILWAAPPRQPSGAVPCMTLRLCCVTYVPELHFLTKSMCFLENRVVPLDH